MEFLTRGGCGSPPQSSPWEHCCWPSRRSRRWGAEDQDVTIAGGFSPSPVTVSVGDTVTWTHADGATSHTVTSDDGLFDSGELDDGDTFANTFTQSGTFDYHCEIHPELVGQVVVEAGALEAPSVDALESTPGAPATGSAGVSSGAGAQPLLAAAGAALLAVAGGALALSHPRN